MIPATNASLDMFTVTHPSNLMLAVVSGIIGAIGLPGNFFLMALIVSEYKKRKPHEWLLFTLAVGDLLMCLNNVALEAPFIITSNFESVGCKIAGVLEYAIGALSFLTPPLVAYNRYLSLYNNQRYDTVFTNRNVFLAWSAMVFWCLCWVTPFIVTGSLGEDDLGLCGVQIRTLFLTVLILVDIGIISVSYMLLLYFSYMVIIKIWNHKKNAGGQSQLQSRLINESQEIITAMLLISAVPLFAQVPGVSGKLLQIFLPPFDPWVSRSATALFPLTSAMNAYITVYVIKEYRKKVAQFLKKSPVSVAPEIQAGCGGIVVKTGESDRLAQASAHSGTNA